MNRETEFRDLAFEETETRVDQTDSGPVLSGYAAVFNKLSAPLGGFREMIRPGAFAKTIQESDIRGLFNHDSNLILGRRKAGTLTLEEDKRGLKYSIPLDSGQSYVNDLITSIERGDVDGNSFSFNTIKDEWKYNDGKKEDTRELIEVRLMDVGPVVFPAYPQTSLTVQRSLGGAELEDILFRSRHGRPLTEEEWKIIERTHGSLGAALDTRNTEPGPELHSTNAVRRLRLLKLQRKRVEAGRF